MAREARKSGNAIERARTHLEGGDNAAAAGGENQTDQALAAENDGGKSGDFARRSFQLDEMQRTALADARHTDGDGAAGKTEEDAFWRAAADRLGFNPATVEEAVDFEDTGSFTAFPIQEPEPEFRSATNEADHNAALERFEQISETGEMDLSTIGGDMRDIMLDIFRNRHKPWGALSTDEQKDVATAIDYSVKATLRRAVTLIAAAGRSSITAQLEKYADKGGEITATIKIVAADDHTVLSLHRASGKAVLIVAADAEPYLGQRRDPPIQPEQPELGFNAGGDPPPKDDRDLAGDEADEEEEDAGESGDSGVRGDESGSEGSREAETA